MYTLHRIVVACNGCPIERDVDRVFSVRLFHLSKVTIVETKEEEGDDRPKKTRA